MAWRRSCSGTTYKAHLATAHRFGDADCSASLALLGVVDELEEHTAWHPGFEGLRESRFYGYHGVLSVLLSIQLGRPISYSSRLTVFQVIEAGLRTGSRVGLHAYAVLHIWAYKTYQPAIPAKQRQWLIEYAHKIKLSIDKGEAGNLQGIGARVPSRR